MDVEGAENVDIKKVDDERKREEERANDRSPCNSGCLHNNDPLRERRTLKVHDDRLAVASITTTTTTKAQPKNKERLDATSHSDEQHQSFTANRG